MSRDYPADRDSVDVSFRTGLPLEEIAPLWRALEVSAQPSFFLTWYWVGCWLRESGLSPELLIARRHGQPVALALLQSGKTGLLRPARHLTACGDTSLDSAFIEYNGFLAAAKDQSRAMHAFRAFLTGPGSETWSSLHLPGVDAAMRALWPEDTFAVRIESEREAPYVDLTALRSAGQAYLASRSANCRQQIKRSLRLFGGEQNLRLETPKDLDGAYRFFGELKTLHQKSWQARGKPGAFAAPFFEKFHKALIKEAWPAGHIDLLRLKAGAETVGCLYNFLYDGQAYAYQSGFAEFDDPRCKPGLVTHSLAAQRYLDRGVKRYLLLAGESRYKTSLSTGTDRMEWLIVRRKGFRSAIEAFAERAKRKLGR